MPCVSSVSLSRMDFSANMRFFVSYASSLNNSLQLKYNRIQVCTTYVQLSTLYHNFRRLETDLDICNSIANGFRDNLRNHFRNIRMMHLFTIEIGLKFHDQFLPKLCQIICNQLRNRCVDILLYRRKVFIYMLFVNAVFCCACHMRDFTHHAIQSFIICHNFPPCPGTSCKTRGEHNLVYLVMSIIPPAFKYCALTGENTRRVEIWVIGSSNKVFVLDKDYNILF